MIQKIKLGLGLLSVVVGSQAGAAVIAIVDSGTDLNHQKLQAQKWVNGRDVDDAVDNDDNGYLDDVHGWNFADSNNKMIDAKFRGSFPAEIAKYFEIQTRSLEGISTQEDRTWLADRRQDPEFMGKLGTFGNFIHGTHVAGIAARLAPESKIMFLKIIPTRQPVNVGQGRGTTTPPPVRTPDQQSVQVPARRDQIIRLGLKTLAAQQAKALAPIGAYLASMSARVANCSFGTSTNAAKGIIAPLLKPLIGREPFADEVLTYSAFFVGEVVKQAQALIEPSKGKTLFVIAAGNDGMNNDEFPTSPANYKSTHTISVAATQGFARLASFSNFGKTMVEVAAPGVGISSAIPDSFSSSVQNQETLPVSGTSQAAPYVAGVVGAMLDENASLSNSDLKSILMQTVDQHDFLAEKVTSGGIVNAERAILAAKMTRTLGLFESIAVSKNHISKSLPREVLGWGSSRGKAVELGDEGYVVPLPQLGW